MSLNKLHRTWRNAQFIGYERQHRLSKESLFLLWAEEMSYTRRGAEMGCIIQVTLQNTRAQESDCVSALSASKLLISPEIQWRNCRISAETRQELLANQASQMPPTSIPPSTLAIGARKARVVTK